MDRKPSQKVYSNFCEVPVVFPIVILGEVPVVFPDEVPVVFPDEVPVGFPDEVPVGFPTGTVGKYLRNFFKSAAGGRLARGNPRVLAAQRARRRCRVATSHPRQCLWCYPWPGPQHTAPIALFCRQIESFQNSYKTFHIRTWCTAEISTVHIRKV